MPLNFRSECQIHDSMGFSLYVITDRQQTDGRPLVEVVRLALQGGVQAVQLREKDLPDKELLELARSLRQVTTEFGAKLLINRRIDICQAVNADGVHLGAEGVSITEAKQLLSERQLIGYSAHSMEEACAAEADGAHFVTFGPVYATPSKTFYGKPVGTGRLKDVCRVLTIPVFALGGIKRNSISEVLSAGARGIALISAVIAAPDPTTEVQSLLHMIEEHAIHSGT